MSPNRRPQRFSGRSASVAAVFAVLVVVPVAGAHVERASYWPDPGVEMAGGQPVGGAVPDARGLFKALKGKAPGVTRVVCSGEVPKKPSGLTKGGHSAAQRKLRNRYAKRLRANPSMKRLAQSIKKATGAKPRNPRKAAGKSAKKKNKHKQGPGYQLRPSEPNIKVSAKQAWRLYRFNLSLLKHCRFSEIQPAVTASGNNDRVVIMPGLYTEPTARSQPTDDPRCDGLEEMNDRPNGGGSYQTGALSYRYQATCPNDQNLIAVIGRQPGPDPPPQPPLMERRGIPDAGACIRCNLQMEGSGLSPDDVIVDAGNPAAGNGGPADPAKHNGIRADRADGFVLRNLTVRHAKENGIYVPEADGLRLERFKAFFNEDYGVLTYVGDHALIQDCEAAASGDSGLYPGAAADVGEQTTEPGGPRYGTQIRRCDMHHNAAGYSGTAGNAVWVHDNDLYDNALGFTTDVFTAAGHPGFPQDSDLIEKNEFYDNNFNPYLRPCSGGEKPGPNGPAQGCSDVAPTIPVPVGTGLWIAGGNNNDVRDNRFWDNWRRGTMLFTVPDAFVCGNGPTANGNQQAGCNESQVNTSYRNRFNGNVMGRARNGASDPNGVDFWWDQFLGTEPPGNGNCWYDNTGKDGTRSSLTADPPISPVPGTSPPGFLPEDCATSQGSSGGPQETELLGCLAQFDQGVESGCTWFTTPPEPQP